MGWGSWSIEKCVYDHIRRTLPAGKTILELGSGWTTGELAKHYRMVSVEHDARHIGKHPSTYIHAPMVKGWYDRKAMQAGLDGLKAKGIRYDLLLIDGPLTIAIGNAYSRLGLLAHIDLFDLSPPIVLDDTERRAEQALANALGHICGRPVDFFRGQKKGYAVL